MYNLNLCKVILFFNFINLSYAAYLNVGPGLGEPWSINQQLYNLSILWFFADTTVFCHPSLIGILLLAAGIIEAVAKDFFDIDVAMNILDMNQETERTGKKEHVVFLIVQKSHRQMRRAEPRLQDGQDLRRDEEVLGLLCFQKAQFFLVGESPGPSNSGVKAEFLNFSYWHLRLDNSLLWWAVLWIIRCLAASLVPTY